MPIEAPGDRFMRVNHAGEHGAVSIYGGQIAIARWLHPRLAAELAEFRSHERRHRAIFAAELARRGRRRCRSYHLCGLGGWALGLVSALLGRSAIAATTVAVESVVLRHLSHQLDLATGDAEAVAAIRAIIADEQDHHDRSLAHGPEDGWWARLLAPLVRRSTEAVICIGMRV